MKKLIVFALMALLAPIFSWQTNTAKAAEPQVSAVWNDPAMAGWAFGDVEKCLNITLQNPDLYFNVFRTDVVWKYGDGEYDQMHASWLDKPLDGSFQAAFDLDEDTYGKAGYIWLDLNDAESGDPLPPVNLGLYMAHNLNVRGMGSAYASNVRADETTDLSQVQDFRSVDLTLMVPSVGKIHYINPLNLTTPQAMIALLSFYNNLDASLGRMGITGASSVLSQNPAEVTLYDLPYTFAPEVMYNGASSGNLVSSLMYSNATGLLSFIAAHFSTYTAVPKVVLTQPSDGIVNAIEGEYTISGTVNDPNATIHIYVGDVDQGTVIVNPDGTFSKEIAVNNSSDQVRITSSNSIGSGSDIVLDATNVLAATLAQTGTTAYYLEILAGLLLAGVVLMLLNKKIA